MLVVSIMSALLSQAQASILQEPVVSAALQLELAQKAQAICHADGQEVAAAFADTSGAVRTLISADNVPATAVESARRKARTAARLGFPTAVLTKAMTEAPAFVDFLRSGDAELILIGGGVPVRVRGRVVGAVGIGGSPRPEADEACANKALDALSLKLR